MTRKLREVSLAHVHCTSLLDVSNIINAVSPLEIEKLTDTHLHIKQKQYHQHAILIHIYPEIITEYSHKQNKVTRTIMHLFEHLGEICICKVLINRRWNLSLF
jgi:hypothetical protein